MVALARTLIWSMLFGAALGCGESGNNRETDPSGDAEIAKARIAVAELQKGVETVKGKSDALGADVERARSLYLAAKEHRDEIVRVSGATNEVLLEAIKEYEEAKRRWVWYQKLVVIAAAVDAQNLEKFRSMTGSGHVESIDCGAGMSTSAFRRLLLSQGKNLVGMDVDHIVPRSFGGADHPANYQLLPSSVNRSIGNQWDAEKCATTGGRCAGAVAISRRCGEFRGTGY